jgi:hypothetical protein
MEINKGHIGEIVGRLIRNTRLTDTAYHDDIFTWITEACADMKTKWVLRQVFFDQNVYFYKAEMPCGLKVLTAVEYKGERLPQRNHATHAAVRPEEIPTGQVAWISAPPPVKKFYTQTGSPEYIEIEDVTWLPVNYCTSGDWYQEDGPGYIAVSFKEGLIRFHYKEVPHDKDGFPLIPDQENYKEALYWYCRMKMIESGWVDPVFTWETCYQNYAVNAERGRAATKYPSTARADTMADMMTLIPPPNYFANFDDFH